MTDRPKPRFTLTWCKCGDIETMILNKKSGEYEPFSGQWTLCEAGFWHCGSDDCAREFLEERQPAGSKN